MKLINRFKELMTEAHKVINKQDAEVEKQKQGVFRVGSSGALVDGDIYAAGCGRLAQARYLGEQTPPTESARAMFQGGFAVEDLVEARFKAMGIEYKKEVATTSSLVEGLEVSGRPDFEALIDGEWVGVEVKSLASPFSVIKLKKNGYPFMKHMIQAATYMAALKKERWVIVVGHTFNVNQNGVKMESGLYWYEMNEGFDGDFFITNDKGGSMKLPFKKQHIIDYYLALKTGIAEEKLVDRPKEKELNVDTYNRCNYCPMKSACNEYDNNQINFQSWLERVRVTKETA